MIIETIRAFIISTHEFFNYPVCHAVRIGPFLVDVIDDLIDIISLDKVGYLLRYQAVDPVPEFESYPFLAILLIKTALP